MKQYSERMLTKSNTASRSIVFSRRRPPEQKSTTLLLAEWAA